MTYIRARLLTIALVACMGAGATCFVLAWQTDAFAQPDEEVTPTPAAEPSATPATDETPSAPAAEAAAEPATEPTAAPAPAEDTGDALAAALEDAAAAKKALDAYRNSTEPGAKKLLLFALLAVLTKLLLSVWRLASDMSAGARRYLPWVALGVGVATGLLAKLAAGEPTIVALLYGAGPPLGVFVHALLKMWRGDPATS